MDGSGWWLALRRELGRRVADDFEADGRELLLDLRVVERGDDSRLQLSRQEEQAVGEEMLNEMVGIGPIQPLLHDDTVNDILVNGPKRIFVERAGKLELSDVTFRDERHLLRIIDLDRLQSAYRVMRDSGGSLSC